MNSEQMGSQKMIAWILLTKMIDYSDVKCPMTDGVVCY